MGVTELFFELLADKAKLRVFLAGITVAMVPYCVTKVITTSSPMIGQFLDTMIQASTDKKWL